MKKFYFFFNEGSKVNQVICAILINLLVFAYGTTIGWMSPMTLLLQSDQSPRGTPMTDTEISWIAASAYLTCVPADIIVGIIGDKIGRKLTLLFLSGCCAGCWIFKLASLDTWALIVARALTGITMAGAYVTCPLYTKEISEDSIRGSLGTLVILFHTTGNLFLYVIGDILEYRSILWICLAIPAVHLVLFMMMPESPSYLIKVGKHEEAARVMAWLRCRKENDPIVTKELEIIKQEQEKDRESSRFALKAILKDRTLKKAFCIAMVVSMTREVCGAIPVLNFAGDIFGNASQGNGLVMTPNQQAMVLGAVQVFGSALASAVVENTGRKPLLFVTSLISGISMFTLASWFLARHYQVEVPGWVPVFTLCLCIFCDSFGLQPVSVVIIGEIFSFKYRGTVMAIAMSVASLADFLQMLFFKPVAAAIGVHVAFYFFAVVCLVASVYIIIVIPETKKKSLSEIYEKLGKKNEKKTQIEI